VIESTNSENARATAASSFSNAGTITLTNSETAATSAHLTITSGTLTNTGTINAEAATGGGQRTIEGNLTDTGTLAINTNTSFDGSEKTLLVEGAINLATGTTLTVTGKSTVTNGSGGKISATGTGLLLQVEGTFKQGLGTTTTAKTSEPVLLDRVALHYTDKGVGKLTQIGAGTLSGTIQKKQTLTLASTCSENNETTATGSFLSSGTINMTNGGACANNVRLSLAGGTLENKGTINVLFPHGGNRRLEGSLVNEKTLSIANDPSQALTVTGSFSQGAKASLKDVIAGSSNYSRLSVTGSVTVGGKLSLKQLKFTGKAAESFAIIGGAARTGEFTSVTGNAIKGGPLHYVAHYTPTGVNLVVE
jgi:fibronectin-binding autotransporter adhesin